MNKEIEEIKRLLFQDRLTQYGKRKLVQYLEQKESILDKVTEECRKQMTENEEAVMFFVKMFQFSDICFQSI